MRKPFGNYVEGLSICRKDTYVVCFYKGVVRSQEFQDIGLLFVARLKKEGRHDRFFWLNFGLDANQQSSTKNVRI